jgi:hypothetical protein
MAKDFELAKVNQGGLETIIATKESATVIEAGDLVALSSNYIIKATAASSKIAYCPNGAAAGTTDVEVTVGNNFTLRGTGQQVFSADYKGDTCDMVVSGSKQYIDDDTSSTNVFQISIDKNAGVVGSADNIECRIILPLF